jgi:hypothetical protein
MERLKRCETVFPALFNCSIQAIALSLWEREGTHDVGRVRGGPRGQNRLVPWITPHPSHRFAAGPFPLPEGEGQFNAKCDQPWNIGRAEGVGHGETVRNWAIIPSPLRNLRQRRGEHRWGAGVPPARRCRPASRTPARPQRRARPWASRRGCRQTGSSPSCCGVLPVRMMIALPDVGGGDHSLATALRRRSPSALVRPLAVGSLPSPRGRGSEDGVKRAVPQPPATSPRRRASRRRAASAWGLSMSTKIANACSAMLIAVGTSPSVA